MQVFHVKKSIYKVKKTEKTQNSHKIPLIFSTELFTFPGFQKPLRSGLCCHQIPAPS